jgi:ribosomal protein L34E
MAPTLLDVVAEMRGLGGLGRPGWMRRAHRAARRRVSRAYGGDGAPDCSADHAALGGRDSAAELAR